MQTKTLVQCTSAKKVKTAFVPISLTIINEPTHIRRQPKDSVPLIQNFGSECPFGQPLVSQTSRALQVVFWSYDDQSGFALLAMRSGRFSPLGSSSSSLPPIFSTAYVLLQKRGYILSAAIVIWQKVTREAYS